jgi:hypothetical protein
MNDLFRYLVANKSDVIFWTIGTLASVAVLIALDYVFTRICQQEE